MFLKLHIFFLSFLLLFLLAPSSKDSKKHSQRGNYQVAVKNNATVDNHQAIGAYHESIQENIPGQPS
jgi:hypothetical protein